MFKGGYSSTCNVSYSNDVYNAFWCSQFCRFCWNTGFLDFQCQGTSDGVFAGPRAPCEADRVEMVETMDATGIEVGLSSGVGLTRLRTKNCSNRPTRPNATNVHIVTT